MGANEELHLITKLISIWAAEISLSNKALRYNDINKISEDRVLMLLNVLYDYELENLNYEESDSPKIDLADRKRKLAYQVTSEKKREKIVDTLTGFVNCGYDKIYTNGIRFFILSLDEPKHRKFDYKEIFSNFNEDKHIMTFQGLIREISKLYATNRNKFNLIKDILIQEVAPEIPDVYLKHKSNTKERTRKQFRMPKYVVPTLVIIAIAVFSSWINPDGFNSLITSIIMNISGVVAAALMILAFYILLRISDKEFNKKLEKHYPAVDEPYISDGKRPVTTKILKYNHEKYITITFINPSNKSLRNIRGKVVFFKNNREVLSVPVSEDIIYPMKEKIVAVQYFHEKTDAFYWDEFDTYIDEIDIDGEKHLSINIDGIYIIRSYSLILNYFNYFRLWKFRIPYEITWLKREWYRSVRVWFIHGYKYPGNRTIIAFGLRSIKLILRLTILAIVVSCAALALKAAFSIGVSFINMAVDILKKIYFMLSSIR